MRSSARAARPASSSSSSADGRPCTSQMRTVCDGPASALAVRDGCARRAAAGASASEIHGRSTRSATTSASVGAGAGQSSAAGSSASPTTPREGKTRAPPAAVVFTLIQPLAPVDAPTSSVMIWRDGRLLRHFPRRRVSVAVRGELDQHASSQVPRAGASARRPADGYDPRRLVICAAMGDDCVALDFYMRSRRARGRSRPRRASTPFSVHEVIGPCLGRGSRRARRFELRDPRNRRVRRRCRCRLTPRPICLLRPSTSCRARAGSRCCRRSRAGSDVAAVCISATRATPPCKRGRAGSWHGREQLDDPDVEVLLRRTRAEPAVRPRAPPRRQRPRREAWTSRRARRRARRLAGLPSLVAAGLGPARGPGALACASAIASPSCGARPPLTAVPERAPAPRRRLARARLPRPSPSRAARRPRTASSAAHSTSPSRELWDGSKSSSLVAVRATKDTDLMETMAACKERVAQEMLTIMPAREPGPELYDLMWRLSGARRQGAASDAHHRDVRRVRRIERGRDAHRSRDRAVPQRLPRARRHRRRVDPPRGTSRRCTTRTA